MVRRRIDALLAEQGLFASREQARAAVLAGEVRVAGQIVLKAGDQVDEDAPIEVTQRRRFVSRGGDKLAAALDEFALDVSGLRAVDVGASTGGFTDCLLQAGAASVVAVDVGYGQLAWSLRCDDRVTVFERLNIRAADPAALGAPFDVVVADLSFISLRIVLPSLLALMGADAHLVMLVKPQFEAGKSNVGKRGVVKDPAVHTEALSDVVRALEAGGLVVRGLTFSPLTGPQGNIEFLTWASFGGERVDVSAESVVEAAHEALGGMRARPART
ncbi:MAG: TlyA family RNA methyltransferase [Coriobacteriia bacterium]|nr:TlyA family RNA methyltransferase [Coriobacteriia bacterium]